eukprot:65515-Rhodomonas_salina.1
MAAQEKAAGAAGAVAMHADRMCELELMNSDIEYDSPTVAGKAHGFGSTKWNTTSCAWEDNKDA